MAATGLVSALILSAALAGLGFIFLTPLVVFLGATETILPHARAYIGYILLGMPIMTASIVLNNLLRFQGSAFYGMIGMVSGAVINIGLDPLFIFVFRMGTGGAALATIISQTVGFALLLAGCLRGGNVRIRLKSFAPRLEIYRQILRGGSPSLLRQGLASVAAILLNKAARDFSGVGAPVDAVIAAISVVNRIVMVANSTLLGFGQGFQPVCGFNYGAELYDRVKRGFWFCVKIATVGLTAFGVLGFLFAPELIALFRDDPEVIRVGALTLRLQCFTFPLTGWVIMNNMTLQTTGKTGAANLLALSRQGLFLLPLLFILAPGLGVLGIQLCTPIADLCTFFLSLPLGVRLLRGLSPRLPAAAHDENSSPDV
jgi:putative MATE family efflux protein